MNTSREIIGEIEQLAVDAIVHQPDELKAAERHFSDVAKKIVEKAMEAVDIMEIGPVCRRAVTGAAIQDYDLLAKLLTDKDFDHDRLGRAIDALGAERAFKYPTFYTPGWLCDLAKRMQTTVGCPSLVPRHIPSGADGTEPAPQGAPNYLEFCGMKMTAFGGAGLPTTFIGKRTHPNPTNPVQIFEIKVQRRNGISGCVAKCFENGELLFTLESDVRFSLTNTMAVKCLRAVLIERTKTNARRHRQEKRKRRAAALSPATELAATVARQQGDDDLAQQMENA